MREVNYLSLWNNSLSNNLDIVYVVYKSVYAIINESKKIDYFFTFKSRHI